MKMKDAVPVINKPVRSVGATHRGVAPGVGGTVYELEKKFRQHDLPLDDFPLAPKIEGYHYTYAVEPSMLDKFVENGVLLRHSLDKVLLCPECHGIPSIRPGCPQCGSSDLRRDELIHHFSCGHVAHLDHFLQADGTIRCRKCQKSNLIINSDYDVTSGMCRCPECDWGGSYPKLVGRCLSCSLSFLVSEAYQQELWEYRVR